MRTALALALALAGAALGGCESVPPPAGQPVMTTTTTVTTTTTTAEPAGARFDQPANVQGQLKGTAMTPLSDLNVVHADVPPVLVAARQAPYAKPAIGSCEGLAAEVRALDGVLGADLDRPVDPADPSLLHRGTREVGHEAMSAVQHSVEGLVPFRSWVRKLSGAERYAADIEAAIAAGAVRRAYLKGLGQAQGCTAPAAPR